MKTATINTISLKRSDYVKKTDKQNAMTSRDQYLQFIANEAKEYAKDGKINVNRLMTFGYYKSDIEEAVQKDFLKVV